VDASADEDVVMVLFHDEPLLASVGCAVVSGMVWVWVDGVLVDEAEVELDADVDVEVEMVIGDEDEVIVDWLVVDVEAVGDEMVELRPLGVASTVAEVEAESVNVDPATISVAVAVPLLYGLVKLTVTVLSTLGAPVLLTITVANAVAVAVLTTCVISGA